MEIREIRAFDGPSIYSHRPVIKMRLDLGGYAETPTNELAGFTDRLLALLPGLAEHQCSRGYPGGFAERLREGTYLAHVTEHIALELQCLSGMTVHFGKARRTAIPGVYDIIVEYQSKHGALVATAAAVNIVKGLIRGGYIDLPQVIKKIKQAVTEYELGPSTAAIAAEAKKRGIPVTRIGTESILLLGYGKKQKWVQATTTEGCSCIAVDIAADKRLTKELLSDIGIPVPYGEIATTAEEAQAIAAQIGVPVVVKPYDGNQGKGVALNLREPREIAAAFAVAKGFSEKVLVEKFIPGRQYRILVVNQKVVAVAERIPTHVIGDGIHSIRELIEITNMDPNRGEEHEKPLTKIKLDPVVIMVLSKQQLTLSDVPRKGEIVYLRENANLSTGGTAVDVSDFIHPENARLAVRAARRIGLPIAGIDMVAEDIAKPITDGSGAIIEINAAPGIRMHHYPSAGKPRNVAGAIIDMLFPGGDNGRIPIISVTGTNGKTTTTRMIGHIFRLAGYHVGMTTTDGVFIDDQCVMEGDTTGPSSARMVLQDPVVEVAVLETARGGIIRGGLAYHKADIGIITNITEDHLGQDGIETLEDLAYVKALVAEAVRPGGHVLLNADDPYVVGIAKRVKANIVYFSLEDNNIITRRYLGAGGRAFFVKNGVIIAAEGNKWQEIIAVRDIPVTFSGIALHNLQNAIMAAAAAYCSNIPVAVIQQGLRSFAQNPGRLNLLEVGDFRVMVDYGHNPAGYEAMIRTVKQLNAARLIGVIAAPGDRRDDVIMNIGRIAGRGFHYLFIKEDKDLRGRKPGETAGLLRQGALQSGKTPADMQLILSEKAAVRRALEFAGANDLVVVFYEKYDVVMGVINDFCLELAARTKPLPELAMAGGVAAGAAAGMELI